MDFKEENNVLKLYCINHVDLESDSHGIILAAPVIHMSLVKSFTYITGWLSTLNEIVNRKYSEHSLNAINLANS